MAERPRAHAGGANRPALRLPYSRARRPFAVDCAPWQALEGFQHALSANKNMGHVWGYLGFCFLMLDALPKAFTAFQEALVKLPDPKVSGSPRPHTARSMLSWLD